MSKTELSKENKENKENEEDMKNKKAMDEDDIKIFKRFGMGPYT